VMSHAHLHPASTSNGGKSIPKVEHVAGVLDKLWARRKPLRPRPAQKVA